MSILNFFSKKSELDHLIDRLENPSEEKREEALDSLGKMEFSVEDGIKLLDASKRSFPPVKYEWEDVSARIIDICANKPYFEYIKKAEDIYDEVNPKAKISILQFLSRYENEKALITYLKLLDRDYDKLMYLPCGSLGSQPRNPEILFPRYLKYAENKSISSQVYLVLLSYLENGSIRETVLGEYKKMIVNDIESMTEIVLNYELNCSIWDDEDYLELRNDAGIHFDLAGYINDPKIILSLRNLMRVKDMKLKMFAAISLIRHGKNVETQDILEIVSDSEIRNWFYDYLNGIGKEEIFPEEYKNQKAFAESNMVNWLIYPTELGRVPDKIELMNVFDVEEDECYLFRFRCDSNENWKDEGWMAGISGPFSKKDKPTTSAEGWTFSHFEKWESKTPEEHFKSISGNIKEYWMKRAEEYSE